MNEIVRVEKLRKKYGAVDAVKGITFSVMKGELFAFLGENGAGKSTTINILCGVLKKTSGKVEICGFDLDSEVERVKRSIGIVFQDSALDPRLTVKENLWTRGVLYGFSRAALKARITELCEEFALMDLLNRKYGKLSGGQKRRIDIARALLNAPEILFLDEPTTGLDPATRELVWRIIDDYRKAGLTIFLTTHYMEEAARADGVVILDDGLIAAQAAPDELKKKYARDILRVIIPENAGTERILSLEDCDFEYKSGAYEVKIPNKEAVKLVQKYDFADFEILKGSMDMVFLEVTGKSFSGGKYEKV